jgi:hypothetical protein
MISVLIKVNYIWPPYGVIGTKIDSHTRHDVGMILRGQPQAFRLRDDLKGLRCKIVKVGPIMSFPTSFIDRQDVEVSFNYKFWDKFESRLRHADPDSYDFGSSTSIVSIIRDFIKKV